MPNFQYTSKPTTGDSHSADKMLTKALLPSILGILICIILLCGTTFAWLNDSVHAGGSTLTAGNFGVTVSVDGTPAGTTSVALGPCDTYYSISIANSGNTKGYAILSITKDNDSYSEKYFLIKFNGSDSDIATVSIYTGTDTFSLQVVPYWGTSEPGGYSLLPENIDLSTSETTSKTTTDNVENEKGGQ